MIERFAPPPDGAEPMESYELDRNIVLTAAAGIRMKRVRWLWQGRMALGELSLLAGREGKGKSTIAYWIASRITRGELPGEFHGTPRVVFVCATEDSWESTIAPRLHAAGADLELIFRVDVEEGGVKSWLSLPRDNAQTTALAVEYGAALLLLDPLMSRLDARLDTHKDAEVRQALEPLVHMASMGRLSILGLIHLNKSNSIDPLNSVMGSRAFAAVSRSVSVVVDDPDDEGKRRRLFGTPKNNLGPDNLPLLPYTIEGVDLPSDDGIIRTGRVDWQESVDGSIQDAMERALEPSESRSGAVEAGEWLEDWLATQGGEAPSRDAKKAGREAGHSQDHLKRAIRDPRFGHRSEGFPRQTIWFLQLESQSESQSVKPPRGESLTALTAPTGADLR